MDTALSKSILCFISFPTLISVVSSSKTWEYNDGVTLKNTIVQLDPYVTILDQGNPFRYNLSGVTPIVTKVATKFNRILIQQSEADMEIDVPTSLVLSSLAAAEYNKQPDVMGRNQRLDVWLSYSSKIPDYTYDQDNFIFHRQPQLVLTRLISVATQTNDIFNETVTRILLPYKLILNDLDNFLSVNNSISKQLSNVVSEWGILVDSETFSSYPGFRRHVQILRPNIVILILRPLTKDNQVLGYFRALLEDLYNFVGPEISHGLFLTIPDTDSSGHVNMSSLVSMWTEAINWAEENGTTVILEKAFDTPYEDEIGRKTNGWWRLVENPNYNNSCEFIFEDKEQIAISVDKLESELMLTKLSDLNCNKSHVEIIFSLYDKSRSEKLQKLLSEETDSLLEKLVQKFNKVVILVHDDTRAAFRVLGDELKAVGRLAEGQIEATLLFLPNVYLSKMIKGTAADLRASKTNYRNILKPVTTYVVPYVGNETAEIENHLRYTVLNSTGVQDNEYAFGYTFNVSICSSFMLKQKDEIVLIEQYLKSEDTKVVIFHFEEDEQTVKLGVERMFRQRTVVLEECRRLVAKRRDLDTVKLSFMMLHYHTNSDFYQSRRDMVNFVQYFQRLSDWAVDTNSTVILSNTMDGQRYFKGIGKFQTEVGWWRYQKSYQTGTDEEQNSAKDKYMWLDKLQDFNNRFPDKKFPKASQSSEGLQTYEIILIVVVPVIISVAVVTFGLFLIRRKYREKYLSKSEIDEFFHGWDMAEVNEDEGIPAQYIPYDKSRYEIDTSGFNIEADCVLGSGEFGKVTRGKVHKDGVTLDAAVKMVNPKKIHRTTINMMLSEIKVLSYVGKHENITELLGANTDDLKNGKVFIFLELCELGSLEKYLRKLRSSENAYYKVGIVGNQDESAGTNKSMDESMEMVSKTVKLEQNILEDMHRWSLQICCGMEYLASKHVVHADLATRNVLLSLKMDAKICDFGLSRRMYNYTNYVKQQQEPLPWKWMSPESLRNMEFSEKSDVWAYGISLWEIFSLAAQPYPGLSWDLKFPDMLEAGLQLCEPKFNDKNVYLIMKECWKINPDNRPKFSDLVTRFN